MVLRGVIVATALAGCHRAPVDTGSPDTGAPDTMAPFRGIESADVQCDDDVWTYTVSVAGEAESVTLHIAETGQWGGPGDPNDTASMWTETHPLAGDGQWSVELVRAPPSTSQAGVSTVWGCTQHGELSWMVEGAGDCLVWGLLAGEYWNDLGGYGCRVEGGTDG